MTKWIIDWSLSFTQVPRYQLSWKNCFHMITTSQQVLCMKLPWLFLEPLCSNSFDLSPLNALPLSTPLHEKEQVLSFATYIHYHALPALLLPTMSTHVKCWKYFVTCFSMYETVLKCVLLIWRSRMIIGASRWLLRMQINFITTAKMLMKLDTKEKDVMLWIDHDGSGHVIGNIFHVHCACLIFLVCLDNFCAENEVKLCCPGLQETKDTSTKPHSWKQKIPWGTEQQLLEYLSKGKDKL